MTQAEQEEWIRNTDFRGLNAYDLPSIQGAGWLILRNGGYTLLDEQDAWNLLNAKLHWVVPSKGTARGKRKAVPYVNTSKGEIVHRVIMQTPKGMQVDHNNDNSLDNRRCNLTNVRGQAEQEVKKKKRAGLSSKFKGVCFNGRRWIANFEKTIGSYATKRQALAVAAAEEGRKITKRKERKARPYMVSVKVQRTFESETDAAYQRDDWMWERWRDLKVLVFPERYATAA